MQNNKKKIVYITGTRADFGLMTPVLQAIKNNKKLSLDLYATGMHLMPQFGNTIDEVKKLFPKTQPIKAIFESDDRRGMASFSANYLKKLVKTLLKNRPDFVLILGDRIEMLCTALACLYLGIPTGQLHGGEKTSTVDELARHAITKLSHLHFPATKLSADRIEKMGEEKWRLHVVGAPALDVILNQKLPNREEVYRYLGFKIDQPYVLVTQHPVSEEWQQSVKQIKETIEAVKSFELPVAISYPNADVGGRKMIKEINKEKNNAIFKIIPSSPYKMFLAMEREAAVWIGNSSAAMIESSSFHTPVVNVGTRQLGRQRGENVIDVGYTRKEIVKAIHKSLYDKRYLKKIAKIKNPWGDGKTGEKVTKILENLKINPKLLNKQLTYA